MKWRIWMEGCGAYTGTEGRSTPANYFGEMEGATFQEACDKYFALDVRHERYYDSKRLTYWGCRLYDNEADARKAYG